MPSKKKSSKKVSKRQRIEANLVAAMYLSHEVNNALVQAAEAVLAYSEKLREPMVTINAAYSRKVQERIRKERQDKRVEQRGLLE